MMFNISKSFKTPYLFDSFHTTYFTKYKIGHNFCMFPNRLFLQQARLWACGRGDMSTPSFGSHLNPISTRGADYAHPIYWCPHQVLKATGAPAIFILRKGVLRLF